MPIYEYECKNCSYAFSLFRSIKDTGVVTCEKCGGDVKKLLSPPAIIFNGPGFYSTDYKNK